ncbi:MAG: EAL domain-containing protein [bacterium]|nr:hypothetical protein [Deltaproteobacteria bacterium]MCP4903407.1 EAL domain-containing protein [bacterium]
MKNVKIEDVLMDALDRAGESAEGTPRGGACLPSGDAIEVDQVLSISADLGSGWTFIIRLEADGSWEREWIGGDFPIRSSAATDDFDDGLWDAYVLAGDRQASIDHFARARARGRDRSEFRLDLPGVGVRWVESVLRCIPEADDSGMIRIYGAMRDITDLRATEEALRKSERQYRALVEQASDGILVFDRDGRILASNGVALDLFGLTRDALLSKRIDELIHPDDLDRDPLALRNLVSGVTLRSVRRLKRAGQEGWIWAELSARCLQDGRIQATARDITARMEADRRIRNLAYFDSLTSLPNRDLFREQIGSALERSEREDKRLALLFLDIDRFKGVNDSLGHSVGDQVLVRIADRLCSAVRWSDSVGRTVSDALGSRAGISPVSRLGGDEFTILIQDLDHAQDAARVARRALHAISRPIEIGGHEIFVGASVGIAVWPEDGECSETLLRSADDAMSHAKSRGGNTYEFFSSTMNSVATRRLMIETRLRHALERNEFYLAYQPIRDAQTGRISAAEALLRWVDTDGDSLGPDEFIPVAEETGLIVEIGAWVLRAACQQAVEWQQRGFESIRLSVNISVEQLRDPGIANCVDQILFDTGLSADCLELEITESSILDESPSIVAAVGRLAEMGIDFALDDFGTGYSSLSALQRCPIDRLKIDRSFVAGVGENQSDEALTSAIVALAQRLDHRVVAEGVETEEQARFLTALGCQELQGFLFSRPLPPDEFEAYLRRAKKGEVADTEGAR